MELIEVLPTSDLCIHIYVYIYIYIDQYCFLKNHLSNDIYMYVYIYISFILLKQSLGNMEQGVFIMELFANKCHISVSNLFSSMKSMKLN